MYETLIQVFYKDRNQYDKECEERIKNPNATILPLKVKDNQTFFLLVKELHEYMISIYKMNTTAGKILKKLPDVAVDHFCRRCLIDEIVLTNSIEGVVSTRKDIGDILDNVQFKNEEKKERFAGLIYKYFKLQRGESIPLNTCEDVRSLYDELFLKEVVSSNSENKPDGKIFRQGSVAVRTETQKEIHFGLEPESKIIDAMDEALKFIHNEEYDILIRTAVFHYYLGYIHPFYDGNGRLSRFISSYLITKELQPVLAYRLSYTIKINLRKYLDAFKTCNDPRNKGDLTPFILMFLSVLKMSMEQLISGLEKRATQLEYYKTLLKKMGTIIKFNHNSCSSIIFILIQAELFSEEGISTNELMEVADISRTTLDHAIKELNRYGLVKKKKDGTRNLFGIHLDRLEELCKDE